MKRIVLASQRGFTLIELVIVIVVLGIIGAVALSQFSDISGDATSARDAYSQNVTDNQNRVCAVAPGSSVNSNLCP